MESSTTTKVNTVTQSSKVGAKNDDFPGGSNFVPSEKQDGKFKSYFTFYLYFKDKKLSEALSFIK